jgi:hypothetical protein
MQGVGGGCALFGFGADSHSHPGRIIGIFQRVILVIQIHLLFHIGEGREGVPIGGNTGQAIFFIKHMGINYQQFSIQNLTSGGNTKYTVFFASTSG